VGNVKKNITTPFLIFQKFAGEMWWCPYLHISYRGGIDSKEGGGVVDSHSQLAKSQLYQIFMVP
jgi:hypothetical protein